MKRFDFLRFFISIAAVAIPLAPVWGQDEGASGQSQGALPIVSVGKLKSPESISPLKLPDSPQVPEAVPDELKDAQTVLEEEVDTSGAYRRDLEMPAVKTALTAPVQEAKAGQALLTQGKEGCSSWSLQETLEQTYMQNAALDAARAEFRVKVETLSQANADWRPSLSVQAKQADELRYPMKGKQNTGQYKWREFRSDYTAVVEQNFFKGGATIAKIGEEESNVEAGKYELGALEQKTLFEAVHAHTEILAREAILRNQLETQAFNKKRYEQAQAFYEVGQGSRGDAAFALAQYEETTAEVAVAIGNLEAAKATYLYQVGTLPKSLRPATIILDIPKTCEEAQKIAQCRNPTIIAAKYVLEAAEYNVNLQIAALLPTVDVDGSAGGDHRGGTDYPFPFNNTNQANMGFHARVNIPLYQKGIPNSKVRQAYQNVAKQKINLVNAQRKIIQDTNIAWATFIAAQDSLKSFIAQVKSLELAVEGVVEEYKVGMKTIVEVFVERDKLTQAQNRLAMAQQKLVDSTYGVLQATGRLTACDLRLKVNYYDPEVYYRNYKEAWIQFWEGDDMRYVKEVNPK